MTINMDKMLQRKENLKNKFNKGNKENPFFKPQAGDQYVRFLPSPDGDPFKDFYLHYELGPAFLCPKRNFNEKCPVCDYAFSLWKEGTDESKKMAKKLFSQQRFYSNVLEREKDTGVIKQGPKPYSYGKETYEQLIETVVDPDLGDFTNPEEGKDFKLNYKLAEKKGAYPKTKLTLLGKASPIGKGKKEIKELLDKVRPVESFLTRKSTEDVQKILDEYLDDPFEEKKLGDSTSEASEASDENDSTEISSVDEAIEELTK